MPTYVSLLRYTQQGVQNIKESPARLDAAKKAFQAMGAEMKAWYLVMGQYDASRCGCCLARLHRGGISEAHCRSALSSCFPGHVETVSAPPSNERPWQAARLPGVNVRRCNSTLEGMLII